MIRVTLTLEGNDQAVSRLMDSLVSSANTWYDLDMTQSIEVYSEDGWDLIREYADWADYKKENELQQRDPREIESFQETAVFATTGEAEEPTEEVVHEDLPDEPLRDAEGFISVNVNKNYNPQQFPTFTWEQADPFVDRSADALERIASALEDIADYLYDDGNTIDEEEADYVD
jgi:hypothetical protein